MSEQVTDGGDTYFDIVRSLASEDDHVLLRAVDMAQYGESSIPPELTFRQRVGTFFRNLRVVERFERFVAPENFRASDFDQRRHDQD